jgi:hypothetical protein
LLSDGKSVIVEVPTLGSHETGEMTVTTKTTGSLKDGDPIVAQAIVAFENPKTSATENAIAYDSDQFSTRGSTLGASIFGLGFLPTISRWLAYHNLDHSFDYCISSSLCATKSTTCGCD